MRKGSDSLLFLFVLILRNFAWQDFFDYGSSEANKVDDFFFATLIKKSCEIQYDIRKK